MKTVTVRILCGLALVLLAVTNFVQRAHAADGCCDRCGCTDDCQKICRLVCEEKKITATCWGCKREDFCVNGRSIYAGQQCEYICDETDPKAPCTQPKKMVWGEWIPGGCAKVYTRSKLMKRTITKTVPSFKYVVEELCPQCEAACVVPEVPAGVEVPPPPKTDARIVN